MCVCVCVCVSRARTLASVLVPHIVARFFSTGFCRWTALELRALSMSFINLGGFRWPVISVFSRPLAGPRSVVLSVSLGLCPVVYAAGAVRLGFVGRAASRRCLFFLMCFACSWSL